MRRPDEAWDVERREVADEWTEELLKLTGGVVRLLIKARVMIGSIGLRQFHKPHIPQWESCFARLAITSFTLQLTNLGRLGLAGYPCRVRFPSLCSCSQPPRVTPQQNASPAGSCCGDGLSGPGRDNLLLGRMPRKEQGMHPGVWSAVGTLPALRPHSPPHAAGVTGSTGVPSTRSERYSTYFLSIKN